MVRVFDITRPGEKHSKIAMVKQNNKRDGVPGTTCCITAEQSVVTVRAGIVTSISDHPLGSGLIAIGTTTNRVALFDQRNGDRVSLFTPPAPSTGVTQVA